MEWETNKKNGTGQLKNTKLVEHSCAVLFQPKFDMVLEKMNVFLSVIG